MQVVEAPNPDYPGRKHDNLWLLVGGDQYSHDLANAYYIGVDLDEDRVDIAGHVLEDVIEEHGFDGDEARRAFTITGRALRLTCDSRSRRAAWSRGPTKRG